MNKFIYITGEQNKKKLSEIQKLLKENHGIELFIMSLLTFDRTISSHIDDIQNETIFILDMANLTKNKQLSYLEKQFNNKTSFFVLDFPPGNTTETETIPPPSFENICSTLCLEGYPVQVHLPVLLFLSKLYLKSKKISDFNSELVSVKTRLSQLVKQTTIEMKKIKKIHEQKVNFREDLFKGVSCYSKYGAGESSGGDFYQTVKLDDHRVLLFLSGTNSYLFTSAIADYFHGQQGNKTKISSQLSAKKCVTDIINLFQKMASDDKTMTMSMLCLEIDINSLDLFGYNFGSNVLLANKSILTLGNNFPADLEFMKRTAIIFKMKRGDRLALFSPGVVKNDKQFDIRNFIQKYMEKGHRLFLDELFYNLRRNRDGDLLSHDAMAIYIEVGKNVIIKA